MRTLCYRKHSFEIRGYKDECRPFVPLTPNLASTCSTLRTPHITENNQKKCLPIENYLFYHKWFQYNAQHKGSTYIYWFIFWTKAYSFLLIYRLFILYLFSNILVFALKCYISCYTESLGRLLFLNSYISASHYRCPTDGLKIQIP